MLFHLLLEIGTKFNSKFSFTKQILNKKFYEGEESIIGQINFYIIDHTFYFHK